MSLLDSILGKVADGNVDVANMAAKLGIDASVAEKAIAALGQAHGEQGDTIAGAAAKTGLDSGVLGQIVQHIGGEGSLAEFARMLGEHPQASSIFSMFDRDGDGNPLNDITGMAKGLFGKE
jgi:hypothetical protein